VALRSLAGERVDVGLLAPDSDFFCRPLSVTEPFGVGEVHRFDLPSLAQACGAWHALGSLVAVDGDERSVRTSRSAGFAYDVLLIAIGARPREAIPGARAGATVTPRPFARAAGAPAHGLAPALRPSRAERRPRGELNRGQRPPLVASGEDRGAPSRPVPRAARRGRAQPDRGRIRPLERSFESAEGRSRGGGNSLIRPRRKRHTFSGRQPKEEP